MHLHHDEPDLDWILGMDRVHHAVVMLEGFDHFAATLATTKGWSQNFNSMTTGRFAGFAGRNQGNSANQKILPSTATTMICGFAFNTDSVNNTSNWFVFYTAAGVQVAALRFDASGHISIYNAANTLVTTGTTIIAINTWYYVELKIFVNGASGTCELHLNGASGEIASTTGNFGSTAIGQIGLAGVTSGTSVHVQFDDLYVLDTTGSAPRNNFLGDVRVSTIMPSSDGAHTDWTPSGAGSHFSKVNELTGTYPDGDTTYVSDSTPGHIDTYGCDDIDSGATVYGVQVSMYARKDDANTRQIAPVIRQGGTDYVGTTQTLAASYLFYSQVYNQDPTAADWTAANVNADEFGIKEIA